MESTLETKKSTPFLFVRVFIVTLFFILSIWRLPYSPATWFDEGINLGVARNWVERGVYSLPVGPTDVVAERQFLITTNYPVLLPVAVALKIFGFNVTAARLPMVLFLWAFVWLAYLVVKKNFGASAAWVSVALIISFLPFYGNGKAVLGEVPGLVYFLAGLLALPEDWKPRRLLAAGLFFGLAAATKPLFLIVGLALFIGEATTFRSEQKVLGKRLVCLGAGALVPLLLWLYSVLPSWSVSGLRSTTGFYANSYAAGSFVHTILTNFTRFVSEVTPVHFTMLAVVSAVGLYKLWRKEGKVPEALIIMGTFILVNVAWYLKTPGWYRYFFTAHLLLWLFFPAALFRLLRPRLAAGIVIALFLFQCGYLITKLHTPLYYATETQDAARWVNEMVPANQSIFVINAPSVTFLIQHPLVYQYLQANPKNLFGRVALQDTAGQPYRYVIVNGGLENTKFAPLETILKNTYQPVKTFGHLQVYVHL